MYQTLRRLLAAIVIVVHSVLCISCTQEPTKHPTLTDEEMAISQAQKYIDSNQSEKAISLLTPYFEKNTNSPQAPRLQFTLASAYVQSSGINISDFIDFFRATRKISIETKNSSSSFKKNQLEKWIESNSDLNTNKTEILEVYQWVDDFYRIIDIFTVFDKIPKPADNKLTDLKTALFILKDDSNDWSHGQYLYRGSLRLILFYQKLRSQQYFSSLSLCQENLETFQIELNRFKQDLVELLTDIELGIKEKKSKNSIQKTIAEVESFFPDSDFYELPVETQILYFEATAFVTEAKCED